tara:strand:+ start:187 stop:855 length:669 start_codon:yes stop_codon:yes gene_type:complete
MSDLDKKSNYNVSFQGDFNFGNIDLVEFSTTHQFSKSIERSLIRFIVNYEYIEEGGEKIASDLSTQIRYNYELKKNSIFAFVQAQNIKSLRMNHRYISGIGYRHNLFTKSKDYWDLSAGIFYENELYDKNLATETQVNNLRYSFSSFSKYTISEKIFLNFSVYYQINTSNLDDYRLFAQPRLYYELEKFDLFIDLTNRYHSTPYIDVYKNDTSLELGVEFSF